MPRLGYQGQMQFLNGARQFLELCVLEDKLQRLVAMVGANQGDTALASQVQQLVIEELLCVRQWKSADHPQWLAFEVEGRIQIRHEQYIVAKHLLATPGSVCQLNMGRGKTRVVLPMLFMEFASQMNGSKRAARATILTPLMSELRHFLQRYMVAGSVGLKFVEMPFHRRIAIDVRAVKLLLESVQRAKYQGDILLVAPEHRMSLELKHIELANASSETDSTNLPALLAQLLCHDHYLDVIDESDAVLHHKFHLVYADGPTAMPLDCGPARWEAVEALLKLVASPGSRSSRVMRLLEGCSDGLGCCLCTEYESRRGAYPGTRLVRNDDSSDEKGLQLKKAFAMDWLDSAAIVYPWAATFCERYPLLRPKLVEAVSNASVSVPEVLGALFDTLLETYNAQLLALRGLIAFGVLEHCLEKRYRVEFGLPGPNSGRTKRLAIPYRAADVPSERAEFSHPDVAITLTVLSYYHSGLREHELRAAFTALLNLDHSEQAARYSKWYTSILRSTTPTDSLSDQEKSMLHDVRHLSLSDAQQFALLFRVFRYCMETIDFFLNMYVFPTETKQYPQRLGRSAWDLAANKDAIMGFSGTNDNQLLLPLSVKQREPEAPDLLATNGKMVNCIINTTNGVEIVTSSPGSDLLSVPTWQAILQYSLGKGAQALIDTGALLAGVATHDAASFVLQHDQSGRWKGVTYYDSRSEQNCWMVLIKATGITVPLSSSHIRERDTFVIFDEARTRGADMKLPATAAAVLTLGPRLTKDKLMQGAGRMRQLGGGSGSGGQTLWFAYLEEVGQQIRCYSGQDSSSTSKLSAVDVLEWVMANTRTEVTRGLIEWASSGIQHERAHQDPAEEVIHDDWSLKTLYASAHAAKVLADIVEKKIVDRFPENTIPTEAVRMIRDQAKKFGLDDVAFVTAHTDECERELQLEEEVTEQQEVHLRPRAPIIECEWDFSAVTIASSARDLVAVVSITAIGDFFTQRVAATTTHSNLHDVAWKSAGNIFATSNFFYTVVEGGMSFDSNNAHQYCTQVNSEWLRFVNAMVVFADKSVLLLSEYEADHVLEKLWDAFPSRDSPILCNLAFALESLTHQIPSLAVPQSISSVWTRFAPASAFAATEHSLSSLFPFPNEYCKIACQVGTESKSNGPITLRTPRRPPTGFNLIGSVASIAWPVDDLILDSAFNRVSVASSPPQGVQLLPMGGKRKKSEEEKEWDASHEHSNVTCKLNQLCSNTDLRDEIQRSCVIFKQIQSEAWHLANLYVLKCLELNQDLPRLDQRFFSWCCDAVRAEGLHAQSTADILFRETADVYRAERVRVDGYVPPVCMPYTHGVIEWMADQMRVNCQNMIVLNFEKRLEMYARLILEDHYEEIALMSLEDRPSPAARERALMTLEDRPDQREERKPPSVPQAEVKRLVRACYRSADGDFTDDEQLLRQWLEVQPFQSVIEHRLELFVKKLYVILKKVEESQQEHPQRKGIRTFSLLPCTTSYVPAHVIINRSTLRDFCARAYLATDRNPLDMPLSASRSTLASTKSIPLQQRGVSLRRAFAVSKFETMSANSGINKQVFQSLDHEAKAPFASRLFAQQITTDGYSASVLMTRPKTEHELAIDALKKAEKRGPKKRRKVVHDADVDYEWAVLPTDYSPDVVIGIDPGLRNLATAAREGEIRQTRDDRADPMGDDAPRSDVVQIHSTEYRHLAGMHKQQRWFENLKARELDYNLALQWVPSFKISSYSNYLDRLRTYWRYVGYFIDFSASHTFRKQRFMVRRMKMKTLDEMAKRVVPVASPQVIIGYGDWSRRDGNRGHGPTPVKGFRRALQRRARVVAIDEYCTSKKCMSCHRDLVAAVLPQHRGDQTVFTRTKNVLRCPSSTCRVLFKDRDVNAAHNMLTLLKAKLRGEERPRAFCRAAVAVGHA